MKEGQLFVSHQVPGIGHIPAIEPVLCRHCAMPLVEKPFVIRVYFNQHEIHFEHIACLAKHDASFSNMAERAAGEGEK